MDVRSRRMEGHVQMGTVSLGVFLRGSRHVGRQGLDCSPGPSNAPTTRVSRDTLTVPDLQMLGKRGFLLHR